MANYRAISTGVASALARWEVFNGSTWVAASVLPQVGDDVYANNFNVTLDINFFTSSYRTTSISGVAAGGSFILNGGITAIGDVYSRSYACISHSSSSNSFVVGNSFGSSSATQNGCVATGTGVLIITGNVYGGAGVAASIAAASNGVYSSGSGSFIVNGNAYAGTGQDSTGAANNGAGGIVNGRAIGQDLFGRLRGAINCTVREVQGRNENCVITEKIISSTGNAYYLTNCPIKTGVAIIIEARDEAGNVVQYTSLSSQGQASPVDVRLGTNYANGALTGTCAVPPAGAVSLGVPVDNTTGSQPTSVVVAADILNEIATSSIPLAERLRNVATTSIVNSAVGSINVIP